MHEEARESRREERARPEEDPVECLGHHARQLLDDAGSVVDDLHRAAEDGRRVVRRSLEERPYETLAVAAAAGFVLAGGLASRLTPTLMRAAGRFALLSLGRGLAGPAADAGSAEGGAATTGASGAAPRPE